ncbi:hypothetical protein CANARDRAFT_196499 [[Candida] arabinofermentans NRRL YB-2248]|uniref:Survival protein SurE-like phosphatase/nucleotidase domain-containing protein n=1 Tax=[Candida] arabinofermentans NRRL YB-2248 TaxID=983967 RepID=A0A1E4T447_9ASCO|nr:hypothetical protein CANARDRAFT_196499 [[Candida] arabinofermentans NRRL YB-2248]
MRVLLTNDDGGPSDSASAYIKFLVEAIETLTDWDLTICVPSSQKSWIGKAHFAGKDVEITYIYSSISKPQDNSFHGPFGKPQESYLNDPDMKEWILVDGTPATCADIGLNHICKSKDDIDLVLSGPNVGRNSSALYTLSSGTIGGAMEGCHHGKKAIALSYAYDKQSITKPEILREASKISIKIIENLYNSWNVETDVYNVNIPLHDDLKLGKTKIFKTPIFENKWGSSLFKPINDTDSDTVQDDIVDGSVTKGQKFKWSPDFNKVHQTIDASVGLSDGKVISEGFISVTALKAVFKQVDSINQGELIIEPSLSTDDSTSIVITYPKDSYIYEPLKTSIDKYFKNITIYNDLETALKNKEGKLLHYGEYEDFNHERIMSESDKYLTNSYIYRKGLIRKHYLANTITHHNSKNVDSILNKSFPKTYQFELDYAEFLDDALDEFYELRYELEENERNDCVKTYILKPSMSDKGQGIRIFKTIDQLQSIFDSFEEDYNSDDEGEEEGDDQGDDNGIITSQLRHFIIQDYISNPLLLKDYESRKFHIRTYVLCVGNLKTYVYQRMLMLFSEHPYVDADSSDLDMKGHLTNTCLQEDTDKPIVIEFAKSSMSDVEKDTILNQINEIVKELYTAAIKVDKINFQPLSNSFEIFGLDFIVDCDLNVSLLEVNSYPDFKQTGEGLKNLIFELFDGVSCKGISPLLNDIELNHETDNLKLVLDIDNSY